jgi:hypothetical protein
LETAAALRRVEEEEEEGARELEDEGDSGTG